MLHKKILPFRKSRPLSKEKRGKTVYYQIGGRKRGCRSYRKQIASYIFEGIIEVVRKKVTT